MRTMAMALLGVVSLVVSCGGEPMPAPEAEPAEAMPAAAPSAGTIERLDPALDELVSPDAVIEHLADGFTFTEGPFWVQADGGFLLFSDVPGNRMIKWTPAGEVSDFIAPVFDGDYEGGFVGSNGITGDAGGDIVFAEHFNGRISRISPDGTGRSVVVDTYEGVRFNSPNDLVYKSDGTLYFTDPAYGLPPETQGQDVHGIYRLSPDGAVERLAVQQAANGLAFSPDESRLYVSGGGQWMVYEVAGDGTLGEGELFLEGGSDGMKVDERGNLWATGRGGVWVISPEGVHLGTIAPNESPANVAFGEADGRTLYMTAVSGLYRVRTNVAGN